MTKKLWQRVAATAMATLMAACTMTAAFAADVPYDSGKTGKITVHKYGTPTAPSDIEANVDFDGISTDIDTSAFGIPLDGVGFTLYSVEDPTSEDLTTDDGSVPGFDFTKDFSAEFVDADTGVKFTDADGTTIVKTVSQQGDVQTTANGGVAVFDNLPAYKLYVLVETQPLPDYDEAKPSFIRVPLTEEDGTTLNYDVHVYPKNVNNIYVTKEYLGNSTDNAEKIGLVKDESYSWKITSYFKNQDDDKAVKNVLDLRSGVPGAYTYGAVTVTDLVEDYFKVTNSTVEVYFLNASGNKIGENLTITDDYTVACDETAGDDLVVALTKGGIDDAITANAAAVVVEFDTVYVDSTDVASSDTANVYKNNATALVKAAGDTTEPTPEETGDVIIPTVDLLINKIDGTTDLALQNVKFKLATDEAGNNIVKDAEGADLLGVTDANGNIIFSNIPYDKDMETTLYLFETKTVAGYQLKEIPIAVKVPNTMTGFVGEADDLSQKQIEVTIKNYPHGTTDPDQPAFQLPLTGGTGTVMLVIAGIGVLVLVGFLTVAANRKSRKEQ